MKDLEFMKAAYNEARLAYSAGEVPVGAVVVRDGVIISRAHNRRESSKDATAHAEILAVRAACEYLGTWRLDGCTVYVTLEPCIMCSGALINARVSRVVFGAGDATMGACGSLLNVNDFETLYHHFEVCSGVMETECAALIREFFVNRRKQGKYVKRVEE